MCILYCCEGRKLDNSLGYYVTFLKERILYCIVLYLMVKLNHIENNEGNA